jgi:hypothetical protein
VHIRFGACFTSSSKYDVERSLNGYNDAATTWTLDEESAHSSHTEPMNENGQGQEYRLVRITLLLISARTQHDIVYTSRPSGHSLIDLMPLSDFSMYHQGL